jgi:hypothetical protein
MQWLPPEDEDDTPKRRPQPRVTSDRRQWWVRWRWAERFFIAAAVVVSVCVICVAVAAALWLIWQIWLLRRG